MRSQEFVDEGLGHSSDVIDLDDATAAIVDPPRFPIAHAQLADKLGLEIAWTMDTHSHADYVTGSPGLVTRRVAVFVAPAASSLKSPHRPVVDGEVFELAPEIPLTAHSIGELAGGIDAPTGSGARWHRSHSSM